MKTGTKRVYDPLMMAEAVIQWLSFPHGSKAVAVERSAQYFGVSKHHMYRLLTEFNNFRPYIERKYSKEMRELERDKLC